MKIAVIGLALLLLQQAAHAQDGKWGHVKGRITWGGKEVPVQQPIASVKNHQDEKACTLDGKVVLKDELYVVNAKNKGLQWTFVWLAHEDLKNKTPLPTHPDLAAVKVKEVAMDQPTCAFTPYAVALREGQSLLAKNSAKIAHSFKWAGTPEVNPGGNRVIPAGDSYAVKDLKVDRNIIQIECAFHPWMKGAVLVFNHPYYAVTDADGRFEFKNAPAGNYRLLVRHSSGIFRGGAAGKTGQIIAIKGGATLDLGDLEFTPPPG